MKTIFDTSVSDITDDTPTAWPLISDKNGQEFSMGTGMPTKDHWCGNDVEIHPYTEFATGTYDSEREIKIWDYRVHPKQIWWTQADRWDCSMLVRWDGVGPWWQAILNVDPNYREMYPFIDYDSHISDITFKFENDVCDALAWVSEEQGDADHKYSEYLFCHDLVDLYMGACGSNRIVDEGWIAMREGPFVTAVSRELMKETMEQQKELNARGLFDTHPPYRIG